MRDFNAEEEQYPSYVGIKCPKCGSTEYKVVGVKKSTLEKVALIRQHSFRGVRANLAASDACENDFDLKLIEFKCLNCKKKFDSYPNIAGSDEILEEPCTIKFIRPSSFLGKALLQQVFLNGIKVGSVPNDSEFSFSTKTKSNHIFVLDINGTAFKEGNYKFIAESGGYLELRFKRKFY